MKRPFIVKIEGKILPDGKIVPASGQIFETKVFRPQTRRIFHNDGQGGITEFATFKSKKAAQDFLQLKMRRKK